MCFFHNPYVNEYMHCFFYVQREVCSREQFFHYFWLYHISRTMFIILCCIMSFLSLIVYFENCLSFLFNIAVCFFLILFKVEQHIRPALSPTRGGGRDDVVSSNQSSAKRSRLGQKRKSKSPAPAQVHWKCVIISLIWPRKLMKCMESDSRLHFFGAALPSHLVHIWRFSPEVTSITDINTGSRLPNNFVYWPH